MKNFDILGARETFDDYVPGETTLKLTGARPVGVTDKTRAAKRGPSKPLGGARFWNWGRDEQTGEDSYERFMSQ